MQYTVCPSGCLYSSISQAVATARSGDTITIGPGTYYENIEIAKGLTLRGAGKEKTIIKSAQLGYPVIRIESDSQIEVVIEDLTAAEAKAGGHPTYDENGIHVEGKARVTIRNVQASGNEYDGLSVGGSAQVTVSNSMFFDNLSGIHAWDSAQVTISDSQISDNWIGIDMCCDEASGYDLSLQNLQ
jgi:parallel beta-helix repeat protein